MELLVWNPSLKGVQDVLCHFRKPESAKGAVKEECAKTAIMTKKDYVKGILVNF